MSRAMQPFKKYGKTVPRGGPLKVAHLCRIHIKSNFPQLRQPNFTTNARCQYLVLGNSVLCFCMFFHTSLYPRTVYRGQHMEFCLLQSTLVGKKKSSLANNHTSSERKPKVKTSTKGVLIVKGGIQSFLQSILLNMFTVRIWTAA